MVNQGSVSSILDETDLAHHVEGVLKQNGGIYTVEVIIIKDEVKFVKSQFLEHGQGCMVYPNGAKYKGSWLNGQANGIGQIDHPDGSCFTGNFAND